MKYAIQVNTGPGSSQSACSAYQFIKAALAEGHEIVRLFFYHDGIYNSLIMTRQHIASGDPGFPDWSGLAKQHGIDLVLCISAAERRGLPADVRLADGFRLGGLGQWMEACLKADRVMVFGG
jgi:tRNA 2-thiouridine synthesizing protein D